MVVVKIFYITVTMKSFIQMVLHFFHLELHKVFQLLALSLKLLHNGIVFIRNVRMFVLLSFALMANIH